MQCKWLVDQYMIDHNEQDVVGLLRDQGFDVEVRAYNRMERTPSLAPFFANDCAVIYGSLQFVAQHKSLPILPGAYFQPNALQCSVYTNQIPPNLLLNENSIMATFGDLRRRPDFFKNIFGATAFIRPNSSQKIFSGCILNSWEDELSAMRQTTSVTDDTIVVLSAPQEILSEHRLFVVNREVVAATQYQKNGAVDLSSSSPQAAWDVAQHMADLEWQPDIAYVCDVAITPNGAKIVELNAISTSGWYLADIPKLSQALSEAAVSEWNGDLALGDQPVRKGTLCR